MEESSLIIENGMVCQCNGYRAKGRYCIEDGTAVKVMFQLVFKEPLVAQY